MASRVKMSLLLILTSAASIACCFCVPYDPIASQYVRHEPDPDDLVGSYVLVIQSLTGEAIEDLQMENGDRVPVSRLVLHADGSFTAGNVPVWVSDWEDGVEWSVEKVESTTGQWNVDRVGSIGGGTGTSVPMWGLKLTSENQVKLADYIALTGQEPPYKIVFRYGDPDSGDAMVYGKMISSK
ncbi:MAG: hypothetical protein GY832_26440 [Chloroflexi bacterium]|nr:hypothetical protein [Chloroflexota bacterium]